MNRNLLENLSVPLDLSTARPQTKTTARPGSSRIRNKIFLVFLAVMIALVSLMLVFSYLRLEKMVKAGIADRIEDSTYMISEAVRKGMTGGDPAALNEMIIEAHSRFAELVFLVVENGSGGVMAALNLDVAKKSGYKMASQGTGSDGLRNLYRKVTPVEYGGEDQGRLYMGFTFPSLLDELKRGKLFILGISAVVLLTGALFALLFSNVITRPLVQITKTAERVAHGDLKQRARVYSRDEIGSLARAFNNMLDGLEKAYSAQEVQTRSLEEKVAGRSIELEREIKERLRMEKELRLVKQELEDRVSRRTEELSLMNQELHGRVMETHRSRSQLEHAMEKLAKALEGTIDAMSLTIEMRDMYTAGHQRRVAQLAVAIAEEMKLPVDKIEGIRMAGIIHDIGKIAMPAEVLTKPARLSKIEVQLIREHPRVGFNILKKIDFPWPVAQIILQHHERMDGSGYPDGLSGEAILLEARILAVADVVEAMSSHRPYRPALGVEKALEEIRRGRGIRYDLQVVDACIRLFKERKFKFKKDVDLAMFQ